MSPDEVEPEPELAGGAGAGGGGGGAWVVVVFLVVVGTGAGRTLVTKRALVDALAVCESLVTADIGAEVTVVEAEATAAVEEDKTEEDVGVGWAVSTGS